MRVTMRTVITGTRDGVEWPAPGGSIDLPDAEAVGMLNAGFVEPCGVTEETATVAPVETATTRRPRRKV